MYFKKPFITSLCAVIVSSAAVAQITGSGTSGKVPKFTTSTMIGDSSITESNGSVGIGTSNPQASLHVSKPGNSYIRISNTSACSYSYFQLETPNYPTSLNQGLEIGLFDGDGIAYIGRETNIGASLKGIAMAPNGNVGVGTKSPDGKLNINGAPNTWTLNGWSKGLRLDGINAIELGGGAPTKYGIGQSDNNLYFFDTTADDNTTGANYRMVISNGNVGIGTYAPSQKLEVGGNAKVNGSLYFGDGTVQSTAWTGTLCGGDYAESVDVSGGRTGYEPGDVLEIDPSDPKRFIKSSEPYSTAVAGIYSTKPGMIGRRSTDQRKAKDEIPMAMIGIVPLKVSAENGPIHPRDLLVTSSNPGYAMRGTDRGRMLGAVIGKAMGSLDSGTGVIEVLVTLQ
jgi:hypothetical protein